MKVAYSACLALSPVLAGAQLANHLTPGVSYRYRVVVTQTEYAGSGTKVTTKATTEMPIEIRVAGGNRLTVTSGPLFVRGRSVGRARISDATLGGPRLPAWLFVPLPPAGVKVGQKWTGPLSVPAPLPAGLQATYVAKPGSKVLVSVKQGGNSVLTGSGALFLNPKSGVPHHGRVLFQIAFMRPDMKDHTKMVVNSHMTVECVVKPQ